LQGERAATVPALLLHSLRFVLEKEHPGSWSVVLKKVGRDCGKHFADALGPQLARLRQPKLVELPLEVSRDFLIHYFDLHAWGVLTVDLSDADNHGIITARLEQSAFVAALPDATEFTDAFVTGVLEGYFEQVTGQSLVGAELACARRGAAHCQFVITTPDRLPPVAPLIGKEAADAILARLRA
jgi:predicted hydrocarbon binding protein